MRALIGLMAAVTLALSGCGAVADDSADAGGSTPATAAETTPATSATTKAGSRPADVAAILEFTGTTVDGDSYDGSQLAGKPAVLWFWAPWCPTCRAQAPAVEAVAKQYDGKVGVVGVGGLSDAGAISEFAGSVAGPTHLVDVDGEVWRHFGIAEQSTYVLLDAEGAVVLQASLGNDELAAEVADLAG